MMRNEVHLRSARVGGIMGGWDEQVRRGWVGVHRGYHRGLYS